MERKGTLQRYPSISEWGKGDFSTKVGKKDAAVVVMLSLRKALGIWCQKGPWLKASINLVFLLCSKVSAAAFGTLHISNISLSLAINLSHHSYRMRQKTNSESKLLFSSLEKKVWQVLSVYFLLSDNPMFYRFFWSFVVFPSRLGSSVFWCEELGRTREEVHWVMVKDKNLMDQEIFFFFINIIIINAISICFLLMFRVILLPA